MGSDTNSVIDLRSDVLAPPTEEMWKAMWEVDLGWSMLGEDRSVKELEALGAEMLGKEEAIFVPTCSIANLLTLMTLGKRGTQVVLEAKSHIACLEHWNVAYICGLFSRLIEGIHGIMNPVTVDEVISEAKYFGLPGTSVVCLENTHNNAGGTIVTAEQIENIAEIAHKHGASLHLDGARLFNAAAALGVPPNSLVDAVDTVAISLNKGLSAPFGALLCGPKEIIDEARINSHKIGVASIHKDGFLAAAGIVALTKMIDFLIDDNRRAFQLAKRLAQFPGLYVDLERVQTNIILVETTPSGILASEFVTRLAKHNVLVKERVGDYQIRLVTHRLIGDAEVERVVESVAYVFDSVL